MAWNSWICTQLTSRMGSAQYTMLSYKYKAILHDNSMSSTSAHHPGQWWRCPLRFPEPLRCRNSLSVLAAHFGDNPPSWEAGWENSHKWEGQLGTLVMIASWGRVGMMHPLAITLEPCQWGLIWNGSLCLMMETFEDRVWFESVLVWLGGVRASDSEILSMISASVLAASQVTGSDFSPKPWKR